MVQARPASHFLGPRPGLWVSQPEPTPLLQAGRGDSHVPQAPGAATRPRWRSRAPSTGTNNLCNWFLRASPSPNPAGTPGPPVAQRSLLPSPFGENSRASARTRELEPVLILGVRNVTSDVKRGPRPVRPPRGLCAQAPHGPSQGMGTSGRESPHGPRLRGPFLHLSPQESGVCGCPVPPRPEQTRFTPRASAPAWEGEWTERLPPPRTAPTSLGAETAASAAAQRTTGTRVCVCVCEATAEHC